MTQTELIKAEIERRLADNKKDLERAAHKNLEDYFEGYEDALSMFRDFINSLPEEPSGLDNSKMPVDRWKEACKAASFDGNYRSHNGLTETRDDYFVDGVQWADEHPYKEPVSKDLEGAVEDALSIHDSHGDNFRDYGFNIPFKYGFEDGSMWQKEQFEKKVNNLITAIKRSCTPNPMGTFEECMAAAEIEALELVIND